MSVVPRLDIKLLIPTNIPTAFTYRFDNFIFFFLFIALGTLAYSWRTVWAMAELQSILGVVFDQQGFDDPAFVALREAAPVEDQGPIGACAANAVVGALEYLQRRNALNHIDLSRLFVYYNARHLGECADVDSGTCLSHVLAGVLAHGACEETLWPNRPENVTVKPPKPCYENALRHQAIEFAMTPLGEAVMIAVSQELPVDAPAQLY